MARDMTSIEEYRRLVAGATPEDDLLTFVETHLTLGRWRWHHIRRADEAVQQGDPGWPDIVAIRGPVLLVKELKAARGRFETGQPEWLEAFAGVREVRAGVWRPDDMDAIAKVLR